MFVHNAQCVTLRGVTTDVILDRRRRFVVSSLGTSLFPLNDSSPFYFPSLFSRSFDMLCIVEQRGNRVQICGDYFDG